MAAVGATAPAAGVPEPVRTCVGCRVATRQTQAVRIVRHEDGTLRLGRSLPGRGAWLCAGQVPGLPRLSCLEKAVRTKAFGRAFRLPVGAEAAVALSEMVQERARIVRVAGGEIPQEGLK